MRNKKRASIIVTLVTLVLTSVYSFAVGVGIINIEVNYDLIKDIVVNGERIEIPDEDKPFIYNNRTYVPVRYVAETFGADVKFTGGNVEIITKEDQEYVELDPYIEGTKLYYIAPKVEQGFNYGYYIMVPANVGIESRILLEGPNSGVTSEKTAQWTIADQLYGYCGFAVADQLKYVYVVPAFPRLNKGVNAFIYSHDMGKSSMNIPENTKLHRIDIQVSEMVKDAKTMITTITGIKIKDKINVYGYSASSHFGDRYVMLHPEDINAYCVGGYNSLPILPVSEYNGYALDYPLGTRDYLKLSGKEFDLESYNAIPKMYYMGELDTNDTAPYNDCFDDYERSVIYGAFGQDMIKTRYGVTKGIVESTGGISEFHMYQGQGHSGLSGQAMIDTLAFFEKHEN